MITKGLFKSTLIWATGNLVVLSTAAFNNSTYEALVLTALWFFIVFMAFGVSAIFVGAYGLDSKIDEAVSQFDLDKYQPKLDQWKEAPQPKAWRSAIFLGGSLFTLAYVEWTVTACVYLVLGIAAYLVTVYMAKVMNKFRDRIGELEDLDRPESAREQAARMLAEAED